MTIPDPGALDYYSKGIMYGVDKDLPANSTVTVYVTLADNQSTIAFVLLIWESGGQTFSAEIRDAAAITSTSRTEVGTYAVPGGKGGKLIAVLVGYHGTAESAVQQGGLIELENDAEDWLPFEFLLDIREGLVT